MAPSIARPTEGGTPEAPAPESLKALAALKALIARLRAEGGCPWDRKQTPESVSIYLLEEVYELVSAIETGDLTAIGEELGDVLFQVLFIAQVYEERGDFNLAGVAEGVRKKMIRRHPHVFGDETLGTAGAVKERWAQIKAAEKKAQGVTGDRLDLPAKLPALLKASRYFDRLAQKPPIHEALSRAAVALTAVENGLTNDSGSASAEKESAVSQAVGDALLHLIHTALRLNLHPESLLNRALARQLSKTNNL